MNTQIHRNNASKEKILASNVLMGVGNDKSDNVEKRITDLENGGGGSGSTVVVTPILTEGTHIASIKVNGNTSKIYAPDGGGEDAVTDVLVDGESVVSENVARIDLTGKQDTLIPGNNIEIRGKTISATDTTYENFGGATYQDNGTRGLVPAPMAGDDDKYLRGDGTWRSIETPQPVNSLDDLIDVELSSPTNGQVLKYDESSNKWVNGNESGGGGSVTDVLVDGVSVVNQQGEAEIIMPTDFVGATSLADGVNGLVPAPSIADKNKFLKGDGTWDDASNIGSLNDLSDVNVQSPLDGDALIYDGANQEWVGGQAGETNLVDDVNVNGVSVVDANKVAQITSYKEITQAEYDALPVSKLTDGVLYCITDADPAATTMFAPVIYSLEEREIGTWTDGKPLYEKVIEFSIDSTTKGNYVAFFHNISDIDKVTNVKNFFTNDNGVYYDSARFSNYNSENSNFNAYSSATLVAVTRTDIGFQIGTGIANSYNKVTVILQYTKITDTPGSGSWGVNGVPNVLFGSTVPSNQFGSDGETYVKTDGTSIEMVYYKINGSWLPEFTDGDLVGY